jgi:hypothetical protein
MRPLRPTTRWLGLTLVVLAAGASWSWYDDVSRRCPEMPLVRKLLSGGMQLAGFLTFHS